LGTKRSGVVGETVGVNVERYSISVTLMSLVGWMVGVLDGDNVGAFVGEGVAVGLAVGGFVGP
jgi:hypothetical protein